MMPHQLQTRRGRQLIEWIALNDDPSEMDAKTINDQLTVQMIASVYGLRGSYAIANEIIRIREENFK